MSYRNERENHDCFICGQNFFSEFTTIKGRKTICIYCNEKINSITTDYKKAELLWCRRVLGMESDELVVLAKNTILQYEIKLREDKKDV